MSTELTREQKRIRIAEACGITHALDVRSANSYRPEISPNEIPLQHSSLGAFVGGLVNLQ